MKRFFMVGVTAVSLLLLVITNGAWGLGTGITGFSGNPSNGGMSCSLCHNGGVVPTVTITGPSIVNANDVATYVLTISGGQEVAGGLNVSANQGSLALLPKAIDMQLLNSEITHTEPKLAEDGSVVFSFQWQAPASAGVATLYGAGNSVDLSGDTTGDAAAKTAFAITVLESLHKLYLPVVIGD